MDAFKIELFQKENPQCEFPKVTALSAEEKTSIRQKLAHKLSVDQNTTGKELLNMLVKSSESIIDYNACNSGFTIANVFNHLKIVPKDNVYINWYQFDNIDAINFNDFNKYFDDIWFPSADDIEVFDDTCGWVLLIAHDGYISVQRLSSPDS